MVPIAFVFTLSFVAAPSVQPQIEPTSMAYRPPLRYDDPGEPTPQGIRMGQAVEALIVIRNNKTEIRRLEKIDPDKFAFAVRFLRFQNSILVEWLVERNSPSMRKLAESFGDEP